MARISLSMFSDPKRLPKSYKARDAAYAVGGNKGFYIASLPRPYPKTPQQVKAGTFAKECGIHSGVSKADVMKGMKCIGLRYHGTEKNRARDLAGVTAPALA